MGEAEGRGGGSPNRCLRAYFYSIARPNPGHTGRGWEEREARGGDVTILVAPDSQKLDFKNNEKQNSPSPRHVGIKSRPTDIDTPVHRRSICIRHRAPR